ncbi:MAG: hypothetical protein V4515_00940 [Chloroflexota bacterium]
MTPASTTSTPHDDHDRLLLAAFAAGDAAGSDLARAHRLMASCDTCRGLVAELQAIARAVHSMPAPRPLGRDYRISADDADRLGRRAGWRRILRPFAARRASILGPVAATLMTLGLAGFLVSTGTPFPFGTGGTTGQDAALRPSMASTAPEASGRESVGGLDYGVAGASKAPWDVSEGVNPPVSDDSKQATPDGVPTAAAGRAWLPVVSGLLVLVGIGVLALRRMALREG